jgi:hypothetical protein
MIHKWIYRVIRRGVDKGLVLCYLDNGSQANGVYVQNTVAAIIMCNTLNEAEAMPCKDFENGLGWS